METKTLLENQKTQTKVVEFRDMIEHLHCFVENVNMTQAQSPERSHSDKLRATRTITDDGASHIFVNEDYVLVLAVRRVRRS